MREGCKLRRKPGSGPLGPLSPLGTWPPSITRYMAVSSMPSLSTNTDFSEFRPDSFFGLSVCFGITYQIPLSLSENGGCELMRGEAKMEN